MEAATAPGVEVVLDPFFAHDFVPQKKVAEVNDPPLAQQATVAAAAPVAAEALSLPVGMAT